MPRRRSLRARILAAFVISSAAFLGALGYGLLQLQAIGQGLELIEVGYLPLSKIAARLDSLEERIGRDVDQLARGAPRSPALVLDILASHGTRMGRLVAEGQQIVDDALPTAAEPQEIAVLTSLRRQLVVVDRAHAEYASATETFLELAAADLALPEDVEVDHAVELEALYPAMGESRYALRIEIDQLTLLVEDSVRRVSARTNEAQTRALVASASFGGVALAVGVVMLLVTGVSLRPIGRMTREVQRIAGGDYAARLEITRRDELGLLAEEVNAMARSIRERDEALRARAGELEVARDQLRSVIDGIRLGLVVVDRGQVSMFNPAAAGLWSLTEGEPLPAALELDGERAEALPINDRVFDLRRVPFGGGFILVGEDVTRLLRDRERLVRSERLAIIGQMLAQITHEVRNPLNAMSLNAELLDEDLEQLPADRQEEARAILGTLTSEIRRLEAVTEHYLNLARRPRAAPAPESPAALVAEVARLLEEELRRAGIELIIDAPDVGEAELDGNQLRQALINVVRNAAEAGAGRIGVSLERAGGEIRIEVTDDGPGMDPETAARAADPFFSTKAQGTGLGLAITRQILEDHGGRVIIEGLEEGTRITLALPA